MGTHQRIDKVAHQHLGRLLKSSKVSFPSIKQILHFEGNNGPDGVKRKSPSVDEPWHYIDPKKPHDQSLIEMIIDHQVNLGRALKGKNEERAAFEAAWLAHAIVDGLTPAHHYPLADKIEELFGKPHHERTSVKEKNLIKGQNRRDTISKNWEYWGGGGIFSTHALFEFGVATATFGKKFPMMIDGNDLVDLKLRGYEAVFRDILRDVVELGTYEEFSRKGWTSRLARKVYKQLMPLLIKAVCLGWYSSVMLAEEKR